MPYAGEARVGVVRASLAGLGVGSYMGWKVLRLYQQVLQETSAAAEKDRAAGSEQQPTPA